MGAFHPRRIVLYGSRARGDHRPDSDYDLFVEIETESLRDTWNEIAKAAESGVPGISVVVNTPDSYERRCEDVGTLEYQIALDGRVLYARDESAALLRGGTASRVRESEEMPASVSEWVEKADEELRIVRQVIESNVPSWASICFLAHEAAEKLVKAAIVTTHQPPPRLHALVTLLSHCPENMRRNTDVARCCEQLDALFKGSRYPAKTVTHNADAAVTAFQAAESIRRYVGAVIDAARTR